MLLSWLVVLPLAAQSAPTTLLPAAPRFDAARAYEHVKRFVDFGPHPPGTAASRRVQEYLAKQLEAAGLRVELQRFTAATPLGEMEMTNIVGILAGEEPAALVLACHYDTKLFSTFTFVGANDGGSGVGVLLELARVLAAKPQRLTLLFVFFDGEEALRDFSSVDGLYGSRHFIEVGEEEGWLAAIKAAVILDLVGDRDLNLLREGFSSPALLGLFLESARRLRLEGFFSSRESSIQDDHLPFRRAGIPAVDLIDFSYGAATEPGPFWHTAEDTLDKLSLKSLKVVGELVLETLPAIELFVRQEAGRE